jgi:hypothetical protein
VEFYAFRRKIDKKTKPNRVIAVACRSKPLLAEQDSEKVSRPGTDGCLSIAFACHARKLTFVHQPAVLVNP